MNYWINDKTIDLGPMREYMEKGHLLQVCQYIIEQSGCSLQQARDLYFTVIEGEQIIEPESAKMMRVYLQAELDEKD